MLWCFQSCTLLSEGEGLTAGPPGTWQRNILGVSPTHCSAVEVYPQVVVVEPQAVNKPLHFVMINKNYRAQF